MEWDRLTQRPEGQFLERKSCYDRSAVGLQRRALKDIARDVAETLTAMANADGGTVAVGIEDDGTVSGVPERYSLDRMIQQVHDRVRPRLQFRAQEVPVEGKRVWIFETEWSAEVHQLTDGRYLLRINDQNQPFPAGDIQAIKTSRQQRLTESQPIADAALNDLDLSLVEELAQKAGLSVSPEEVLIRYRLAETINGQWRITLAALLLFGKDPGRWHPRCGIEFLRWRSKELRTGTEFNVIKRIPMEAPLVRLIQEAFQTIQTYIPERQTLVDLFFEERLEYPTFAWQEAIINAVAHRDYRLTGIQIEVHLFDDRMEIRSPGELVEPVTLERLRKPERVHASRNPRIVRVLTELGYMRELGEGIRRMFEVMEREGLHPPRFDLEGGCFVVTLYSEPIHKPETLRWLKQFDPLGLSRNQKRLLAYAHAHGGCFTSRAYQKLVGVDIYTAAKDIQDLRRKGIVRLIRPKGRIYEVLREPQKPLEKPKELLLLEPILRTKGYLKNEDIRQVLGVSISKARDIAQRLVVAGWLEPHGERRWRCYTLRSAIETSQEPIEMSQKIAIKRKPRNRRERHESAD